ncbi:MAG: DUF5615 family PIN-like protein [Egibacteraceae bacterium]
MKWLIDEMFPAAVAAELEDRGHGARAAVHDLRGLTDAQLLDVAVAEGRVLVTENVVDFARLLQVRQGEAGVAAVVLALKSGLPRDPARLARALAERLDAWARDHRDPFPTAYCL